MRDRNMGWPSCREAAGHGVFVVVVGVTPHQGGRESRLQGEGRQVLSSPGQAEVCAMQNANTYLGLIREISTNPKGTTLESVLHRKMHGACAP